uniref:Uncharacterized protein n=1 Tax=Arundo donax TaxID=35708 RepID=A0A0A9BFV7_ARUDO
MREARTSGR